MGENFDVFVDTPLDLYKKIFLVFVGPDCSGKSSLVSRVSDFFGVPVVKGLKHDDRATLCDKIFSDFRTYSPVYSNQGIIMDRWQFPDDIIYEEVFGQEASTLLEYIELIKMDVKVFKPLFIYVKAEPQELERRFMQRGDEFVNSEQILKAATLYEKFFEEHSDLPFITIDTTNLQKHESFVETIYQIVKYYEEEK